MLKHLLLVLLELGPKHGYELKREFERLLGGTWTLNIGQVYMTLSRLEEGGLVTATAVPQEDRPDRKVYEVTDEGRRILSSWLATPSDDLTRIRDEVFLKLVSRFLLDETGARALVAEQRSVSSDTIAELSKLRASDVSSATALLLDALLLRLAADLEWLTLCESFASEPR